MQIAKHDSLSRNRAPATQRNYGKKAHSQHPNPHPIPPRHCITWVILPVWGGMSTRWGSWIPRKRRAKDMLICLLGMLPAAETTEDLGSRLRVECDTPEVAEAGGLKPGNAALMLGSDSGDRHPTSERERGDPRCYLLPFHPTRGFVCRVDHDCGVLGKGFTERTSRMRPTYGSTSSVIQWLCSCAGRIRKSMSHFNFDVSPSR